MKKPIFIAGLTALAVAGIALAEPPKGGKRPGGGTPEARAAMFIQKGDKDGDGKLDKEELTALFKEMDANRGEGRPGGGKKTT